MSRSEYPSISPLFRFLNDSAVQKVYFTHRFKPCHCTPKSGSNNLPNPFSCFDLRGLTPKVRVISSARIYITGPSGDRYVSGLQRLPTLLPPCRCTDLFDFPFTHRWCDGSSLSVICYIW